MDTPQIILVVDLWLVYDHKLWLGERAKNSIFQPINGKLDQIDERLEMPLEALGRELKEEVNLTFDDLKNVELLGFHEKLPYFTISYRADLDSKSLKKIKLDLFAFKSQRWIFPKEIDKLLMFADQKNFLKSHLKSILP